MVKIHKNFCQTLIDFNQKGDFHSIFKLPLVWWVYVNNADKKTWCKYKNKKAFFT